MLTFSTPVQPATLVVEESDTDFSRYKGVHAADCGGVKDPNPLEFTGDTVGILAWDLVGFAVIDSDEDESELPLLDAALKPCARKVLGL